MFSFHFFILFKDTPKLTFFLQKEPSFLKKKHVIKHFFEFTHRRIKNGCFIGERNR